MGLYLDQKKEGGLVYMPKLCNRTELITTVPSNPILFVSDSLHQTIVLSFPNQPPSKKKKKQIVVLSASQLQTTVCLFVFVLAYSLRNQVLGF